LLFADLKVFKGKVMHRIAENNPICKFRMLGLLGDSVWPSAYQPSSDSKRRELSDSIIYDARNRMEQWSAKHPSEPDVAWGSNPNYDRANQRLRAGGLCINGIQPATRDPGAEAGERIRLEIGVAKLDYASPGCTDPPAALPLDARVTDDQTVSFELISDLVVLECSDNGTVPTRHR
jgi:hypothetical protein